MQCSKSCLFPFAGVLGIPKTVDLDKVSKGIVNEPVPQNFKETCRNVWQHVLRNKYGVCGSQYYNVLCGCIILIYCNCFSVWQSTVFYCRLSNACHMHSFKYNESPWLQHNWKWLYRCFCSVVENVVMFTFCGMF
jgi:hypothetical protein